jgi:hypothetical protein
MTQDTEARRSVAPNSVAPGKKRSGLPGIGLTIAIAVISGVVGWFWLASGRANLLAPNVSELTEVTERDVASALTTMAPNLGLDQFRDAQDGRCRRPLAWVSLVSAPGEPPSHIRLISGNYYSPVFEVTAVPVRVALPYPAPYETGRGVLTAIDVGGSTTIALLPAWRVAAQDGRTTRAVTWQPVKSCPSNG